MEFLKDSWRLFKATNSTDKLAVLYFVIYTITAGFLAPWVITFLMACMTLVFIMQTLLSQMYKNNAATYRDLYLHQIGVDKFYKDL